MTPAEMAASAVVNLEESKHLKGRSGPPVSDVTFLDQGGQLDPPLSDITFLDQGGQLDLLVENTTKLYPGPMIQSRPCRP